MTTFKKIYIEITNSCNLACSFCGRSSRPTVFMSPAVFAEVLERIKGATRFIALHVLGEPLLHPDLALLLVNCQDQGMKVNLTTNGTLLARHRQTLLTAPALRQINISLHGLAQLEPKAAQGHLEEIFDFAREASRATTLYISLRLWNLRQADGGTTADGWNAHLLQRLAAAFGVPAINAVALNAARGIPLAARVFLNPEQQFAWPSLSAPDLGGHGYCRGLRDHLAILVDRTVVPCCLDAQGELGLGNIRRQPLAEILAAARARQIREGFAHQWLVEPLCRRCTYRQRFSSAVKKGEPG